MSLKNFLPLRREVMDHWIYKDNDYFKVWVEMLFRARFLEEPKKDMYEGSLYTINQGEFLFSRPKWSLRLNVKDHKLRKLIKLLTEEEMIEKKGRVGKSGATIYLIKNYNKYNNCANETPALTVENTEFEQDSDQPNANQMPTICQRNANETPLKKNVKNEKELKNDNNKPSWSEESDEYRLSLYLYNHMLKNNPEAKKPNLQSWCKHIDYMIRLDNRSVDNIKKVIEFCQNDSFWKSNILSTSKLRDKYDQLYIKLSTKKEGDKPKTQNLVGALPSKSPGKRRPNRLGG